MSAAAVQKALRRERSAERAKAAARFFKTGPGEYGEGDRFLGVTVPEVRRAVRAHPVDLAGAAALLRSEWHEERLAGAIALAGLAERGDVAERERVCRAYLGSAGVNNWDLVDVAAPRVVGAAATLAELERLARKGLWERRIAMVATLWHIQQGRSREAFRIADMVLGDREDLMHKATGWMLREVGKRCGEDVLRGYLRTRYARLPRTALRYAIERFPAAERKRWLRGPVEVSEPATRNQREPNRRL